MFERERERERERSENFWACFLERLDFDFEQLEEWAPELKFGLITAEERERLKLDHL